MKFLPAQFAYLLHEGDTRRNHGGVPLDHLDGRGPAPLLVVMIGSMDQRNHFAKEYER